VWLIRRKLELSARCKKFFRKYGFRHVLRIWLSKKLFAVLYPTEHWHYRVSLYQLPCHGDVRVASHGWESLSVASQGVCFMWISYVPSSHPTRTSCVSKLIKKCQLRPKVSVSSVTVASRIVKWTRMSRIRIGFGLAKCLKICSFHSVLLHYMLYTSTWTHTELSNDVDNALYYKLCR
jgi:hypothetical protein